jgi:hypothetical protein
MISYESLLNIAQNPFSKDNMNKVSSDDKFYKGVMKREFIAQVLRKGKSQQFCDEVMVTSNEKQ